MDKLLNRPILSKHFFPKPSAPIYLSRKTILEIHLEKLRKKYGLFLQDLFHDVLFGKMPNGITRSDMDLWDEYEDRVKVLETKIEKLTN